MIRRCGVEDIAKRMIERKIWIRKKKKRKVGQRHYGIKIWTLLWRRQREATRDTSRDNDEAIKANSPIKF